MGGLIGASRAAIFRRVHIQEARDHFVVVERGEQSRGGFARAHNKFSWAVGHRKLSKLYAIAPPAAMRNHFWCAKKKRPGMECSRAFCWLSLIAFWVQV